MRETVAIGADIHFGPANIGHKYYPATDKRRAYGVLKIDGGGNTYVNLYFDADPAHIDAAIAELVALRADMTGDDGPEPAAAQDPAPVRELCSSSLPLSNGGSLRCALDPGHFDAHSAIAGRYRWLGHGADARDLNGVRITPAGVAS